MIKIFEAKCKENFKYNKKEFVKDEIYKGYIGKSGYIVINDGTRVLFIDRRPGHLRWGNEKGFKNNFEIQKENIVSNQLELKQIILLK